jgi:hypothetical protein
MNDRPNEPINATTARDSDRVAIASKFAPKVFVTYPSLEVWRSVFDPNDLYHRYNDKSRGPDKYQSERKHHLASVTKVLNRIHDFSTGKVILRQLQAISSKFIVEIYPRAFRSAEKFWENEPEVIPKQLTPPLTPHEDLCLHMDLGDVCAHARFGGVNVFFDAHSTSAKKMLEDNLAHALVHAGRHGLDIRQSHRVLAYYSLEEFKANLENISLYRHEEFVANLIENIFRSERGAAPFDYDDRPINPKPFLTAEIRNAISELLRQQPVFRSIAFIQCHFNPIRDVAKVP